MNNFLLIMEVPPAAKTNDCTEKRKIAGFKNFMSFF